MERKLKSLFDYQKFEQNSHLAKIIGETEDRYAKELSDEDLDFVYAAGEETLPKKDDGSNFLTEDSDPSSPWYGIDNSEQSHGQISTISPNSPLK